jgi:NAD(P)-dependent dehydrogenase (short-subunit alcohol dehydrogenase family)
MVLDRYRLTDKIVVITGAAGLLGRRHVEAVLEAGGVAVAIDRRADALAALESDLARSHGATILTIAADITDEAALIAARDLVANKHGHSGHVLVNNAAIDAKFDKSAAAGNPSRFEHFSRAQWDLELAVGLTGSFLCSKIFGTEMARQGGGVIVNVASDLGLIAPDQRIYRKDGIADDEQSVKPVTYSVIKHGLIGLTKYLATYWPRQGVRCNAFAPGGVFNQHDDAFVAKLTNLIPMGRMAHIDEYKAAIVFLCSDASSYMNGGVLTMDGGRSAW